MLELCLFFFVHIELFYIFLFMKLFSVFNAVPATTCIRQCDHLSDKESTAFRLQLLTDLKSALKRIAEKNLLYLLRKLHYRQYLIIFSKMIGEEAQINRVVQVY